MTIAPSVFVSSISVSNNETADWARFRSVPKVACAFHRGGLSYLGIQVLRTGSRLRFVIHLERPKVSNRLLHPYHPHILLSQPPPSQISQSLLDLCVRHGGCPCCEDDSPIPLPVLLLPSKQIRILLLSVHFHLPFLCRCGRKDKCKGNLIGSFDGKLLQLNTRCQRRQRCR